MTWGLCTLENAAVVELLFKLYFKFSKKGIYNTASLEYAIQMRSVINRFEVLSIVRSSTTDMGETSLNLGLLCHHTSKTWQHSTKFKQLDSKMYPQ